MNAPILQVKGLSTEFKSMNRIVRAVDRISFSVSEGETMGIVGESGCGKSVTSLSIMRLLPKGIGYSPEGEVIFDGRNLLKLSDRAMQEIRGKDMAMIFQEPMTSLNPVFRIGDQIAEVLQVHEQMNKKAALQKAVSLLDLVGISRPKVIAKSYPHQLSGGMLQRVVIAIGLACNPKLLIADEPTTALDVTIQAQILELMQKLRDDSNTAIIFITHNLGVVAEMCDRVLVMYAGQVVEESDVMTIFAEPAHPYTRGLMSCMPRIDREEDRLNVIEGIVPSLFEMPAGCRFAPRCPYKMDRCECEHPDLYEVNSEGHLSRCFLNEGDANDKD